MICHRAAHSLSTNLCFVTSIWQLSNFLNSYSMSSVQLWCWELYSTVVILMFYFKFASWWPIFYCSGCCNFFFYSGCHFLVSIEIRVTCSITLGIVALQRLSGFWVSSCEEGEGNNGKVKDKPVCTACHKCSLFKQMVK